MASPFQCFTEDNPLSPPSGFSNEDKLYWFLFWAIIGLIVFACAKYHTNRKKPTSFGGWAIFLFTGGLLIIGSMIIAGVAVQTVECLAGK